MSKWHISTKDGIDFDLAEREVNIFAGYDDEGNNYVTMTFDQIKELAAQIDAHDEALELMAECKHGMPLVWNCNACSDSGDDPRKSPNT